MEDFIREPLSNRERQILRLIVEGETNKEIAHFLNLSLNTVKRNVSNILLKLGAQNRTDAARIALQYNILAEEKAEEPLLSEQEKDVLRLFIQGYTNKVIASRLGVSRGTVGRRLKSARKKLGVKKDEDQRTALAIKVVDLGLL